MPRYARPNLAATTRVDETKEKRSAIDDEAEQLINAFGRNQASAAPVERPGEAEANMASKATASATINNTHTAYYLHNTHNTHNTNNTNNTNNTDNTPLTQSLCNLHET